MLRSDRQTTMFLMTLFMGLSISWYLSMIAFIWVGFFISSKKKKTKTLHWLFKFGLLMHEQPGHDKYLTNSSHYLIDTTILVNGVVLSNMSYRVHL